MSVIAPVVTEKEEPASHKPSEPATPVIAPAVPELAPESMSTTGGDDYMTDSDSIVIAAENGTTNIAVILPFMLQNANHTYHSPELMMYMILELVSGTSYNSILYQQPVGLEELKPQLHQAVRGIFNQYRADEITDIPET